MFRTLTYLIAFALVLAVVQPGMGDGPDPNLVGWWRLNDGSDTAAIDSSGNNLHGELVEIVAR